MRKRYVPLLLFFLCGCALSHTYERAGVCRGTGCIGGGVTFSDIYSVLPSDRPGFYLIKGNFISAEGYIEHPLYFQENISFSFHFIALAGREWRSDPEGNMPSIPELVKWIGGEAGVKVMFVNNPYLVQSLKFQCNFSGAPLLEGGILTGIKIRGKEIVTLGIKAGFPYYLPHSYPALYLLIGSEKLYFSAGMSLPEGKYYQYYGGIYIHHIFTP